MLISSSVTGMESARSYSSTSSYYARIQMAGANVGLALNQSGLAYGDELDAKSGKSGADPGGGTADGAAPETSLADQLEEMRAKLNSFTSRMGNINRIDSINTAKSQQTQIKTIRQQCINFLFQALFSRGRRGGYYDGGSRNQPFGGNGGISANLAAGMSDAQRSLQIRTLTVDLVYEYQEIETTTFSTAGSVKCADGREISFNLNLQMSREFQEYYEENYSRVDFTLCDPLVINLEGNIAVLSDQTFTFDIDGDGTRDNISRLGQGSGYLALDLNGDGTINDGSELFGTQSGNGFADLARYDLDGNGWIDEGDGIWDKLKIWVMDENGGNQLYSLAEKGLGAICLSSTSTDFSLTNPDNSTKGVIRSTGIFLYENGAVGSIQHVDVAKYDAVS